MKRPFVLPLILFAFISSNSNAKSSETLPTFGKFACTKQEDWTYHPALKKEWRESFAKYLSGKMSHARGFAEALFVRREASTPEDKALGEYWISLALYRANLIHIAQRGFSVTLTHPVTEKNIGILAAVADCATEIANQYPSVGIPESMITLVEGARLIKSYPAFEQSYSRGAFALMKNQLSNQTPNAALERTIKALKGARGYEEYAVMAYSSKNEIHDKTVINGVKLLKQTKLPKMVMDLFDTAKIITGRSYYALGRYKDASVLLKKVNKGSNYLAHSLSNLGWAYLQDEKPRETVGTAINLQSGGLRKTFAPEAPMLMAMALNELCQYPESVRAVGVFRKNYKDPYFWLKNWNDSKAKGATNFYSLAKQFLKESSDVPERVASEWIRSPLFIARQDEINLFFSEKKNTVALGGQGQAEQDALATELLKSLAEFKEKYKLERVRMKPGESFSRSLIAEYDNLKNMIDQYKRFRKAAPVWRRVLANHESTMEPVIKGLIDKINTDLTRISNRMFKQLEEVAENNQLIEIEIYNGASSDIIWQNAHKDYNDMAKQIQEDSKPKTAAKNLNWGSVQEGLDGSGEVWEDELGSFAADLVDNCGTKDKYLSIKRKLALDREKASLEK